MLIRVIFFVLLLGSVSEIVSAQRKLVTGRILDEETHLPVGQVSVIEGRSGTATISSTQGSYSLYLQRGEIELVFSAAGYTPERLSFHLTSDTLIDVRLMLANQDTLRKVRRDLLFNPFSEVIPAKGSTRR